MKSTSIVSSIIIILVLIITPVISLVTPQRAEAAFYLNTVYVDGSKPNDLGDGSSWATAKKYIQSGVDLVAYNGTVYVAAGTYIEPYTIRIADKICTLIGAGAATTFIDGGNAIMQGKTVIQISNPGFTGAQAGRHDDSAPITLSGITIQNGNARIIAAGDSFAGGMPCGGGIYVSFGSYVTLNDCVIRNNTSNFIGGGIYSAGQLTMNRCTVSGNSAYYFGGGIANFADHPDGYEGLHATLNLVNCTVSGNSIPIRPFRSNAAADLGYVVESPMGGGVYNGANANFVNVTLANNTVPDIQNSNASNEFAASDVSRGAGLANVPMQCTNDIGDPLYMPIATFKNTIVAANTPENCFNIGGTVTSLGNNLDSDNTCGLNKSTDILNANPQLGPLQNNGGQTLTCSIMKTSPAYNHGDASAAPVTDQRGYTRPTGICSMGAFEPLTSSGTVNTNLGGVNFSLESGSFSSLSAVSTADTRCGTPAGYDFPFGLFSFNINNFTAGQTVRITIKFPRRLPAGYVYYKCLNGSMVDCTAFTTRVDDYTLVLSITDGGLTDADGLANGVIVDPGGPAERSSAGATVYGQGTMPSPTMTQQAPVALASISVKSASLSSNKVAPGETVTVTADVINTGTTSGSSSIQVYVNGAADTAQGVTVNSGSSTPVTFNISRNEPGTYTVHVGGTNAGSFTVDTFANPNIILYISGALILFALICGVIYMIRRRTF